MTKIRGSTPDDIPFLQRMLYEAANWRDRSGARVDLSDPQLSRYIAEWGRPGDVAVVATDDQDRAVGAAWFRFFTVDDPGYGFIDETTPEITIAVSRDHHGRGIGTALLSTLIEAAMEENIRALSLSVEQDNPAVRLYERHGFRTVRAREGALTMRRDF